ncbi:hypothetical protein E2C01_010944 [Portunus trituberculatus]|uniref:Uncharacterized protein n=1 Tax=Portunus trituberculatus TaxID=210409 RepID=A0A5B7D9U0_PORTR|nr:hypothetical protein [Portunus trituberculatus]
MEVYKDVPSSTARHSSSARKAKVAPKSLEATILEMAPREVTTGTALHRDNTAAADKTETERKQNWNKS